MSKAQVNVCEAISPVLSFARWTGLLPIVLYLKAGKHSNLQCYFRVSRFWTIFSIIIQVLSAPFVVILVLDLWLGFSHTEVLWNALKIMFLVHEIELYGILTLSIIKVKPMCKILEQLTTIPSTPEDMKWIGKFMKIAMIVLLLFFSLYTVAHLTQMWIHRNSIEVFALNDFSRSMVGIVLYNYIAIFTQVQCLLCVLLCLLISSKFNYLTNLIKITFNKTSHHFILDTRRTILVKPASNLQAVNSKYNIFKIDTEYLESLHGKYCEILDCLDSINNQIGFQLLLSISVILYTLIYFIFCEISVEGYNNDTIFEFTSIFGTCILIIRLTLYMWAGHKVKEQSGEPLKALQSAKLLQQSPEIQQQLQIILLQWASKPGYLNAFYIMNVGPWLLTSIIGNVITYLLVFVQISKSRDKNKE